MKKIGLCFLAAACAFATTPAVAQTAYEQCLIDYCFGNYQGNPTGYQMCREWCARQTGGPQLQPASDLFAKVD